MDIPSSRWARGAAVNQFRIDAKGDLKERVANHRTAPLALPGEGMEILKPGIHEKKGTFKMECNSCGKMYHINPEGRAPRSKKEKSGGSNMDSVSTKSLSIIDSIRNHGIILVMECPSCHRLKSVLVQYEKLIDLPSVDELEAVRFSSAPPRGGIPHHVPALEQRGNI